MSKTDAPLSPDAPPGDPTADGRTWRREGQGPMTRLEQDALRAYFPHAERCWDDTGVPMARFHRYAFVDGWRYVSDVEVDPDELADRQARQGERGDAWIDKNQSYYEAEIRPELEAALAKANRKKPRREELGALVTYLEACIDAFGYIAGDLHWRMAAGGKPPGWQEVYAELTGEPPINASVFLQAVPNRTTRMVARLRSVARIVQSHPELEAVFATRSWERLPSVSGAAADEFGAAFADLIRHHGRRTGRGYGSSSNMLTPTWGMRPESVYDVIAGYARLDLDDMERLEGDARAERHNAARRMRRRLAGDEERLATFERGYRKAIFQVQTMEDHNHLMEQETNGRMREAIDWAGRYLVAEGHLDDADDIFHLTVDDLRAIEPHRLRNLVAERKVEVAAQSATEPPRFLGPQPDEQPVPDEEVFDEGVLRGEAASRGTVTGRARVVGETPYPPEVEPGDILVARDAGPAWTPVFPVIAGLVLDQGASYQHAALVAREYRIPAVIGTRRATTVIVDGQVVTVDGTEGVVLLSP